MMGVLLSHAIADGKHGLPGDPLPGGQLGSAANVAFWGSMFDDDEEATERCTPPSTARTTSAKRCTSLLTRFPGAANLVQASKEKS